MYSYAFLSDIGLVRSRNEDSVIIVDFPDSAEKDSLVFILADGMGGHKGGQEAAVTFTNTVTVEIQKEKISLFGLPKRIELLKEWFLKSAKAIYNFGQRNNLAGLGTTGVIGCFYKNNFTGGWIGDSRIYVYHDTLQFLTKDHTLIQKQIDRGELQIEDAWQHPSSHILDRCLGLSPSIKEPDICTFQLEPGDVVMSCSDGLHDVIPHKEIESIFQDFKKQKNGKISSLAELLVKAARALGGPDNVSVALVRYDGSNEI